MTELVSPFLFLLRTPPACPPIGAHAQGSVIGVWKFVQLLLLSPVIALLFKTSLRAAFSDSLSRSRGCALVIYEQVSLKLSSEGMQPCPLLSSSLGRGCAGNTCPGFRDALFSHSPRGCPATAWPWGLWPKQHIRWAVPLPVRESPGKQREELGLGS